MTENITAAGPVIWKSFLKALFWLLINWFFGLFTLIVSIFFQSFIPNVAVTMEKVIEEGVLLFFCVAISAAAMVDYIFVKPKFPKYIEFGFYACPFVCLVFSSLVFSQLFFHQNQSYNLDKLITVQTIIIVLTVFYCLGLKTIIFVSESQ
ncbi:MAG: hypothetical protein F6K19_21750 [Cyanothece sp. SIO1E1]|nr:hypothetical protein [Cyanothece sp. SIO1E1]